MDFKIEKGVSIPPKGRKEDAKRNAIINMQIGDSIFFEKQSQSANFYYSCIRLCRAIKEAEDREFTQRKVENGYRVWRTK